MTGSSESGYQRSECPECEGRGVKGGHGDLRDCPACKGTGEKPRHDGTTLLVICGLEQDDNATPFIIGAFNEEYLNQLPLEDWDEQVEKLKKTWSMDPEMYEWRELRVWVSHDHIDALFDTPTVIAEILGDDSGL